MTVDIDHVQDDRLTIGHGPQRIGHREAYYYILTCDHGTTQLHSIEDTDPEVVKANLVAQHHDQLEGCTCQP